MENLANGTARLTSMIELTSAFYEAILHNSYINDPEMWMNYAKFKSKLYRNVTDTLAMGENTQVAVQSNCSHTSLQGSHASSKNTLSYQKNSKAEASLSAPSVNTLLYSDAVPDSLGNEDKNLKIFHPPDKNAHSNNITEFISTAKSLLSKFDAATTEVLQGHSTITEFNGARLVVPSKSAFYRVIAFCYIESLLLGKVPKSRTILRNLFHLVYQGKLALKGPNSVSPSETLRNTFCGYTKELIRLTLVGEAQAVTAFYTMINHDPAFDQSMVSLVKEIIITSLGSSSFVDENLPNSTEVEVKRTIDGIKNSTEITETLMSLVAVIFQVHLSLYSVEGKEVKERVFVPSSDGTDQSFTLSIISQNYRGYLNYFALYVKDKPTLSTLDLVSNPSKPQIVEPTKPEEREVITSQDEYFALGKPENMIHRNNSNQSTPTTPAKKVNMDDSPNSGASPSRFRKAHQPVSAFADATRSSENSATLKPQPIVKEANMISPKSMQPAPTRSFEYKPGEFKKLAAGDGSQYRVKPEANSNSASTIEETSRPRSTSTNALPNQQPQETQYLRPAERDSLSPGHKRSASDVRLIHGRKSLEIQEFFKHQQELINDIDSKIATITKKFEDNTPKLKNYVLGDTPVKKGGQNLKDWRDSRPSYQKNTQYERPFLPPGQEVGHSAPMMADSVPRKQPSYQPLYKMEPIQTFNNQVGGYTNLASTGEKKDFHEHFRQNFDRKTGFAGTTTTTHHLSDTNAQSESISSPDRQPQLL